jgi:hypothetical protein
MNAPATLDLHPAASLGWARLIDTEQDAFLSEIPTETSLAERRLLLNLFRDSWDGRGHVVEIGPFLGGTTRAIALGMAQNQRAQPEAGLHTFDRFDAYYSAELLRKTIEPLVRAGLFSAIRADELCCTADFERLFRAIHEPHDYAKLIHLHNSPLPDWPQEIDVSQALDCLDAHGELGALFIDGCKSWASTHYAMKFLLPRTRVGAPVIFQDYGWYTCFWISSFVYALRDWLEFETAADSTYVFRLKRAVMPREIADRFSCRPEDMGRPFFSRSATALYESSRARGDLRGELIAQLHHVAALVTLDRKADAAGILSKLDVRRYAADAGMIRGCIKSPTYLPGGTEILWR